jgi:hypothetical protein
MLEGRNAPRISRESWTWLRCVLAAVIDRDLGGFTEAKTHPTDSRTPILPIYQSHTSGWPLYQRNIQALGRQTLGLKDT